VVSGSARLDRESRDRYDVTLAAFDGGDPSLNGSTSLQIVIDDANDNAPVFERAVYTAQVYENATAGARPPATSLATDQPIAFASIAELLQDSYRQL